MVFKKRMGQAGFTVVELMIAISVFSVAITLVTAGVMQVTRQYQQASTRTQLESAARDIHQQVAQSVQFAGGTIGAPIISGQWATQCIGNQQYTYAAPALPLSIATYGSLQKGLFLRTNNTGLCTFVVPGANDRNLLPPRAVVLSFSYDATSNGFTTSFASADADLLEFGPPVRCKTAVAGREFCTVVQLNSSFTKRVNK